MALFNSDHTHLTAFSIGSPTPPKPKVADISSLIDEIGYSETFRKLMREFIDHLPPYIITVKPPAPVEYIRLNFDTAYPTGLEEATDGPVAVTFKYDKSYMNALWGLIQNPCSEITV